MRPEISSVLNLCHDADQFAMPDGPYCEAICSEMPSLMEPNITKHITDILSNMYFLTSTYINIDEKGL